MAISETQRWTVSPDPSTRRGNHLANIFHTAIEHDDITQAKILLKYENVKLETRNVVGQTALQRCSYNGNLELARLLLEHGAELETRDPRGWTALHYAASNNQYEIVRFLLAHCASTMIRTNEGCLPSDYATREKVRKLLIDNQRAVSQSPEPLCNSSSSSGVGTDYDDDPPVEATKYHTLPGKFELRKSLTPSKIPRALQKRQVHRLETNVDDELPKSDHLDGLNLTLRRRPKKCSDDYSRYLNTSNRRTICESDSSVNSSRTLPRSSTPLFPQRSASCDEELEISSGTSIKRSQSTKIPSSTETANREHRNMFTSWMRNSFGRNKSTTTTRPTKKLSLPVTQKEQRETKSSMSLRKRLRLLSIRRTASETNITGDDTFLSPKVRRTTNIMNVTN